MQPNTKKAKYNQTLKGPNATERVESRTKMKEKSNQANKDFESWRSYFLPESEAGHVLKMFLNFKRISGWCSYKLGSYKKKKSVPTLAP